MRAFSLFEVQEPTTTLKPRSTAAPQVYAVDPGIARAVSRANRQDIGKRFETAVHLELRRRMIGRRTETITLSDHETLKSEAGIVEAIPAWRWCSR